MGLGLQIGTIEFEVPGESPTGIFIAIDHYFTLRVGRNGIDEIHVPCWSICRVFRTDYAIRIHALYLDPGDMNDLMPRQVVVEAHCGYRNQHQAEDTNRTFYPRHKVITL
ncbi:hypothetical protein D3C81_1526080 [compost metagenome]